MSRLSNTSKSRVEVLEVELMPQSFLPRTERLIGRSCAKLIGWTGFQAITSYALSKKLSSSPNIMAFKQAYRTDTAFLLFADLATGGDLYSLLIARGYFSELETKWIVRQIVFAVDYMHTKGIAHRDLKLENIMCAVFPSSTDRFVTMR
ncbi:hypothetical protein MCOR02_008180 [Pyricularia oryzae]|nr:hypothetical protein MCOR02_008180 [Pyricularia oryzae]